MKRFRFTYQSRTAFSLPVTAHSFLLRATPLEDGSQHLEQESFVLEPEAECLSLDHDKWGAKLHYGIVTSPHSSFSYRSSGIVEVSGLPRQDAHPSPVFTIPTGLTACSREMAALCSQERGLSAAMEMALRIKETIAYVPGSTGIGTSAAEAFRQRKGVCQDFSHILTALCRECGIPARYVCGFVTGEGETHAWTEIWDGGSWYGVDATSGLPADDRYIAVAYGRDASDCSVSRGIFTGTALQETVTKVIVEEIDTK